MPASKPPQVLQIVEVLGPAEQGKSRPFKCRAEDGHLYFVKGQQTNRASLWREWICAHLAQALDLPLPPFCLVQIEEVLFEELPADWRGIGCLPAFASRQQANAGWMELGMTQHVPAALQCDVLVFDWWIHNTDRLKGNTNLLWNAENQSLVVIDHNLALAAEFDAEEFQQDHVFAAQWPALAGDLVLQAQHAQRLIDALPAAERACELAPREWLWENSEFDVPARFDRDAAMALLSRCSGPELWRTT